MLTLASGITLVLLSDAWRFSMLWVATALFVMVIAGSAETLYFAPQLRHIESAVAEKGAVDPSIRSRLGRIAVAAAIMNLGFLLAVWLMVFKPTI